MQLIHTLKTNWRDFVVGIALTLFLAFLADVMERMALTDDGSIWLVNVVHSLRGLAAFAGANLAAFFMIAVAWPSLNKFSNHSFSETWKELPAAERLTIFVVVAIGYLIGACLCFAP